MHGSIPTAKNGSPNPPEKLTSQSFLPAARAGALIAPLCMGGAVFVNLYPETSGIRSVIPFLAGGTLMAMAGICWHGLLGAAADAKTIGQGSIFFALGTAVCGIAIGVSALPLAATVGGPAALQTHQYEHINVLNVALDAAASNATNDQGILTAVVGAAENIWSTSKAEGDNGVVTAKPGEKTVWATLRAAAGSFDQMTKTLTGIGNDRNTLISRAREDVTAANAAISAHDSNAFEENARSAAANIVAANAITYAHNLAGFGNGLPPNGTAGPIIDKAVRNIQSSATTISKQRRTVSVPPYVPLDYRAAMIANPQPFAWIAAISIEILPMILMGLLLALPREPQPAEPEEPTPMLALSPNRKGFER